MGTYISNSSVKFVWSGLQLTGQLLSFCGDFWFEYKARFEGKVDSSLLKLLKTDRDELQCGGKWVRTVGRCSQARRAISCLIAIMGVVQKTCEEMVGKNLQ